ncbi:phage tail protein [Neomegalonema sp.]|uniref:phage tail protein n=1 Tax=Neomegalonema sp. TaxID=2039713 RepID=UPI0026021C86|nr:phage tail protein [Neomegalonema sp.]MDD2870137.1 phage tail protein [Neomegalonema sp.]
MGEDLRLLPAGIDDERSRALLRLIGRLDDLDLATLLIYRLDDLPEEALPLLAWQFDLLGSAGWDLAATPEERRAFIRRSLDLHRRRGTPWAIREAIKAVGYAGADILEGPPGVLHDGGQAHDASGDHGGGFRWATFSVLVELGETKGLSTARIRQMIALIETWKNARSHLVSLGFRARVEDDLDMRDQAAMTAGFAHEDVFPWGRRHDGSLRHDHALRRLYDAAMAHDAASDHAGWKEIGVRHDGGQIDLTLSMGLQDRDRIEITPLHDGRHAHSGISHGAERPWATDPAMQIRATRHFRHDGRHRHAGDLHDGALRHDGMRGHFTGLRHSGPLSEISTVI